MKLVQFLHNHGSYNGGELAGFSEADAEDLVSRGIAKHAHARRYATLEELEAEVIAAGYAKRAAKKIARERFDGKYGEDGRYLKTEQDAPEIPEEATAELVADPALDAALEDEAQEEAAEDAQLDLQQAAPGEEATEHEEEHA